MTRQELESKAMSDYLAVVGKTITVTQITGYNESDDSVDLDGISFEVIVEDTPESDIRHWIDEFLDPYWNVRPMKEYPELAGLRSFWTYGHSYNAKAEGAA